MKKRMKPLWMALVCCLFCATILLTSALAVAAEDATVIASGACGTNLTWQIDDAGTLTINGTGAMETYSRGSAPWYAYRTQITKIIVGDGVTRISAGAFYGCSHLKELTIPFVGESRTASSYQAVFGYIFGYTTQTATYSKGSGYWYVGTTGKYIEFGTRGGSSSSSWHFTDLVPGNEESPYSPGGVWQFTCYSKWSTDYYGNDYYYPESYYYYIPESITKVTITGATEINEAAFLNCANITEVVLNDEIASIGDYAFQNCGALDTLKLSSNLTEIGTNIFNNCDALTDVEIPVGVTAISDYAFYDCNALTNVKLLSNITTIGSYSFSGCDKLRDTDLPENLVTIGNRAFEKCSSFTHIIIPTKVTSIGSYAFSGCTNVLNVTLGNSVKTVGSYAFSGCTNVLNVTLGNSVKTVGSYAFRNLSKITEFVFPDSVTNIGSGSLYGCTSLKELTIPFVGESRTASSYQAVFGYIFGYTTQTATYSEGSGYWYVGTTGKYIEFGTRGGSSSSSWHFTDLVPGNEKSPYSPGGVWQFTCYSQRHTDYYGKEYYYPESYYYYIPESITKVTITGATEINEAAFLNCANITEVVLNDEIASIGDYAFQNCGVVNSSEENFVVSNHILLAYKGNDSAITIPDGIKLIAPRAFYENRTVGTITLADDTYYIGAYAFYNCTSALVKVPRISGTLTIESNGFTNTASVKYLDKSSYTNGNDTYYYTIDGEGNAVIVGCTTTSTNITLPNTLGGYTVTTVGYKGMANCTTLKSVTIPSNIIKLDLYAFYGCTGLDTATIPATCVYVGEYAFAGCTSMTSVVIAEGVTHLGDNCFENCTSLIEIVVPDSCVYLGKYALYNCKSLESATIGINVPSIGKYTFYNCEKLKTVVIGIKVESIGEYAFYNAALERVSTPATLRSIGDYAFAENTALTRVSLKSGIQSIGNGAFYGDSLLATINLPATIKTIGSYAFYDCVALTSITLPALVKVINDYTFTNCIALTTLKINAETVTIGDKAFAYCSALNSVTLFGKVTAIGEKAFYRNALVTFNFTDGLESIGADAFAFNNLEAITLPNTLVYIGEQAFNECASLATVSMPDSVDYVGAYAFSENADDLTVTIRCNTGKIADYMLYNMDVYKVIMENGISEIGNYVFALCHELTEIAFPSTLKKIGDYAFYDNRSYSELTLPSAVTSIGSYAFARGYELVKINIPDSVQSIEVCAFYRDEASDHIHPEFTIKLYYNLGVIAEGLLDGQHMQHVIVDDNIHTVGNNAFSNCVNLQDIVLPDTICSFGTNCFVNDNSIVMNVHKVDGLIDDEIYREKLSGVGTVNVLNTNVGDYAFYGNSTLLAVNVDGEVQIGEHAFAENPKLKNVTICGETDIGDHAFSNDIGLLKTVVEGSSNVGDYSFYNCNAMTEFVIDGTIERIGEHAFDSCKALKAMILPATVNYIGSYAFYDCNSMKSINLPYGIEKILSHTFYGCASLDSIETPDSVIAIEDYAFYGCVVAKSITLSEQCKTIGEAAFYNCKALEELKIPDSVTSIGEYAFRSCGSITELVFSDNVETVGACAFYDCNDLETVKLGKKIIALGDRLFYGCVNLESLYVYAPLSYIDTLAFYGADFVTVYCGWDDYMIEFFDENGIYYEILDELSYQYKITFVTDSGEIISSGTYAAGAVITAPANPTKTADKTYTYAFVGWDQEVTVVDGNKTYTAIFTPVYIEYTIVFKNHDGTTLSSKTYHYGDKVTAPTNPTRSADKTYTYTFAGWNNEVVACEGEATYTALYTPKYIDYTVTFKNYDGNVISSKTYHYGDSVTVPSTPTKAADAVCTYVFAGWNSDVTVCDGNKEYIATFTPKYIEYSVTWVFESDSGVVSVTEYYTYNQMPEYKGEISVPSGKQFSGWNEELVAVTANATYTAKYENAVHVFGEWSKYNDTLHARFCDCGEVEYGTHSWDDGVVTKAPTSGEEGERTYTCTLCDATKTERIDKVQASGDLDKNGSIDNDDLVYLLMHTFFPDLYPVDQDCDFDKSGAIDNDDIVYLLMHTFFPDLYPIGE